MINAIKGIIIGVVGLVLVVILCTTVLPTYLPTDGTLDFLPTIIMITFGFGVALFAVMAMFKSGKV